MDFDPKSSVFSTSDGKLKIFHGDFFKCPIENFGLFDAIWDRGSFGSFDFSLRGDYVKSIKRSVLDPKGVFRKFNYILQTYEYDRSVYGGPPAPIDKLDIATLFATWLDVTEIDQSPLDRSLLTISNPPFPEPTLELTLIMTPKT